MRRSIPVAVLFAAAALPFARQLLFGAGILDDDIFLQSVPAWEWLSRALRSGESVTWSPELMGGFPIAFSQYPFLYPPDLLLVRLLPPLQAYGCSLVLHLFMAGLLTYLFLRSLGLGLGPALLAALSYQMSTEVVAGSSGFAARSAFVLPGALLAVEMVLRGGWRRAPLLALLVAAALLGGHPQLVILELAGAVAYVLYRFTLMARRLGRRAAAAAACWLCAAALLGVVAAAARLLPTLEVVALSTRAGGIPEGVGRTGSLALQGLLAGYLLPLSRLETLPWGAPGYAGPAVLVLAAVGLHRRVAGRRSERALPHRGFFVGLGAGAALLSLGEATPLFWITRLPLFSFFLESSRASLLLTFSLAVLGGMALEELEVPLKGAVRALPGRWVWATVAAGTAALFLLLLGAVFQFGSGEVAEALRDWSVRHAVDALDPLRPRMALAVLGIPACVLLLALAAGGRLPRRGLELSLILVAAAVLVPVAAILNPPIDAAVMERVPDSVRFLEAQPESSRVAGHRPGIRLYNHMAYHGPGLEARFTDDLRYRFQAEMLAPVLNLRWGISSPDGYEALHSRYQEAVLRYIDAHFVVPWLPVSGGWSHLTMDQRARVLRMLNVRYLLSGAEAEEEAPGLRQVAGIGVDPGPNSRAAPRVRVLEIPDPLPRYFLVGQARTFERDGDALEAVALGEVDPARTVMLPADDAPAEETTRFDPPSALVPNAVESVALGNARVALRVFADRPAYLVTSDSFWPGWRAFVDGQEVPVLRANVSGRAVRLESGGPHLVTFSFEPPGFHAGLVLSGAALLVWLLWVVQALRRSRIPVAVGE